MKVFIESNSPLLGRAAAMLSKWKIIFIAARLSKESTNESLLSVNIQPQQQITLYFDSYMGDLLGETEMSVWFSDTSPSLHSRCDIRENELHDVQHDGIRVRF